MTRDIVTVLAGTVGSAVSIERETLAVHSETLGLFALAGGGCFGGTRVTTSFLFVSQRFDHDVLVILETAGVRIDVGFVLLTVPFGLAAREDGLEETLLLFGLSFHFDHLVHVEQLVTELHSALS